MAFEVFKKSGCVTKYLGVFNADNSALAALKASEIFGSGLFKVCASGSNDGFAPYRVK